MVLVTQLSLKTNFELDFALDSQEFQRISFSDLNKEFFNLFFNQYGAHKKHEQNSIQKHLERSNAIFD